MSHYIVWESEDGQTTIRPGGVSNGVHKVNPDLTGDEMRQIEAYPDGLDCDNCDDKGWHVRGFRAALNDPGAPRGPSQADIAAAFRARWGTP